MHPNAHGMFLKPSLYLRAVVPKTSTTTAIRSVHQADDIESGSYHNHPGLAEKSFSKHDWPVYRLRALTFLICLTELAGLYLTPSHALADAASVKIPPVLSLDNALHIMRTQGYDVLIAAANVQKTEGLRLQVGAVANPLLGGATGKTFNYNPPSCAGCSDVPWIANISDQGALFDLITGKRDLRVSVADAALRAANLNRQNALRELDFEVKSLFARVSYSKQALKFSREVAEALSHTLELMHVRYKAGAISEADDAKVETAKLGADQDVTRAEEALRISKVELAYLLGVRGPVHDYDISEELVTIVPMEAQLLTDEERLTQTAFKRRPDLGAVSAQTEQANAAVSSAKRRRIPDIALNAQYFVQGTGYLAIQPPTLTVGLQLPLPIFYQQQGEVRQAEADLNATTAARAKKQAEVRRDVAEAYVRYTKARQRIERTQGRLLERANRARELVKIQYEKGAASLLEFLDAQRTFIAVNQSYLFDITEYWTALFALERASGADLRLSKKSTK